MYSLLFSSILYKSKLNLGTDPVNIGGLDGGETQRRNNGDDERFENVEKVADDDIGIYIVDWGVRFGKIL